MSAHMDGPESLARLVESAAGGDSSAWDELVERYATLVVAVCRRYRLRDADMHDVSQTVWLRLVEHLPVLREPLALPGWLVTTTRRECLRVLGASRRQILLDEPWEIAAQDPDTDAALLEAERRGAMRDALSTLPPAWRELMTLLVADPPLAYNEISERLGMPVGSIGPTRARCIARMREVASVAALLEHDDGGIPHQRQTRGTATGRR